MIELDGPVVGAADELEVVRRHEDGGAGGVDLAQQLEDAARRALVEIAGGLVGDEHEGIVDERPRERDALLFAARQLAGQGRRLGRAARPGSARARPCRRSSARGVPMTSSANATFCLGGAVLEQPEVLEDDAEPPAQLGDLALLDRASEL